jgi:hypothetical protein
VLEFFNNLFIKWLTKERKPLKFPLSDFERIRYEVRHCDVLLVEGRSRVSDTIKFVTQSSWSHAMLYIGKLHDIEDPVYREKLAKFCDNIPSGAQLVIEGMIGKGTIVSSMAQYKKDHIRICRPRSLSANDAQKVIHYAIDRLGTSYDVGHIFDLYRFLIPWGVLPRKWRSKLFRHNPSDSIKTVCSTVIAEAFNAVEFPILPYIQQNANTGIELIKRNPKLFTPRDFDYSPYFEIIKYPFVTIDDRPSYRKLPWNRRVMSNDNDNITPDDTHTTTTNTNKTTETDIDNVSVKAQIVSKRIVQEQANSKIK